MKVNVDFSIKDCVVYSKANNIHMNKREVVSLVDSSKPKVHCTDAIVSIIAKLNDFTKYETYVYEYIMMHLIHKGGRTSAERNFYINKDVINMLAKSNNISVSSVNRGFKGLCNKGVLHNVVTDNKVVPNWYQLDNGYNFTPNFVNNSDVKGILIIL
jgi:hypothetical protein